MKIADTWDIRFLVEYLSLNDRARRLADMIRKYYEGHLEFEPKCPISLLERQLEVMKEYNAILEERAAIEGINLE